MYTTLDLINKTIIIARKRQDMYKKISSLDSQHFTTAMIANTLVIDAKKTLLYYEKLKMEVEDGQEEIDFATYDKISFLINEFKRRFVSPTIYDVENLLKFSLDFEKQVIALFIDIQGRLIHDKYDVEKNTYKILSSIIEAKQKHINNLEMYIKE
ncbi:hypothetical protein IZY60_05050 [Lutibacter sp. B2]|nr:hypothetical protein [Lutibacter sp. B2]